MPFYKLANFWGEDYQPGIGERIRKEKGFGKEENMETKHRISKFEISQRDVIFYLF